MKKEIQKAKVNKELGDFQIGINSFGEIVSNIDIDKINAFLNDTVEDRKLVQREGKFAKK